MNKTTALQNLLHQKATEQEIQMVKRMLASGEISIGGNVNQSIIILGSGNTVELPRAVLDLLNAHALLGNLDRDLTAEEITTGLRRLDKLLPNRAPILLPDYKDKGRRLRSNLKPQSKSLSESARKEQVEALAAINSICLEAVDISFNSLCLGVEAPKYGTRCPFRGLESFRVKDREFFFGREELTQKLVKKIQAHSFLAVLGASGSGKSSLVMAGIIPTLNLDYAIIRPGNKPIDMLNSAQGKSLLVVDQFEELFTLTRDEKTRRDFISALLESTRSGKVIITLRSDFLAEAGSYRSLSNEIQSHLEIIPPMNADELHHAMAGQARWARLEFEADLSQQILDDVVGEPGAMPLLQHAMWELWNRRHGRHLRASEYRTFGGVKQAITSTAEKVYEECSKHEQEQVRDIFLRLTRLDEGNDGRDTRRHVPLDDLLSSHAEATSITTLLEKLASARLIVKTLSDNNVEIEVAHESLIRHWERLRVWLNEDRDNLRLRESVSEAAKEWEKSGRHQSLLNSRWVKLDEALLLSKSSRSRLTGIELAYLHACEILRNDEQRERERRLRYTVLASIVAAIIFLTLGVFGYLKSIEATNQAATAQANANIAATAQTDSNFQKLEAQRQAQVALARQLAAQSGQLLDSDSDLGILLAIQANMIADIPETRLSLIEAIEYEPTKDKVIILNDINPKTVVDSKMQLSPDGHTLIATINYSDKGDSDFGCSTTDIFTIDTLNGKISSRNTINSFATIQDINPLGDTVGLIMKDCGKEDRYIGLWSLQEQSLIKRIDYFAYDLLFLRDNKTLVAAGRDAKIVFWNVNSGQPIRTLEGNDSSVSVITADMEEKILISGSFNGKIILWDIESGAIIDDPIYVRGKEVLSYDAINSIVVVGNNRYVVATALDQEGVSIGKFVIWDLQSKSMVKEEEAAKVLVDLHSQNKFATYEMASNTIKIWDINNGEIIQEVTGYNSVVSLNGDALITSPDGKWLYGLELNKVLIWNLEKKAQTGYPLLKVDVLPLIAVRDDGKVLAIGGNDKIVTYNLETGEISNVIKNNTRQTDAKRLAFQPNHSVLAILEENSLLKFFDLDTNQFVNIINEDISAEDFAFSSDGQTIAVVEKDQQTVKIIDLSTNVTKSFQLEEKIDPFFQMMFSADNNYLVMGGLSHNFYIWNFEKEQLIKIPLATYRIPPYPYTNPIKNEVAVSILPSNKVDIYDLMNGNIVKSFLVLNSEMVAQPIYSSDGNKLAVAVCPQISQTAECTDAYAYIFDVDSGKPESKIPLRAFNTVFSEDGNIIFSVGNNGVVYAWNYNVDSWRNLGCKLTGRSLTADEWNTYIGSALQFKEICNNDENVIFESSLPPLLRHAPASALIINDLEISTEFEDSLSVAGEWSAVSSFPKGISENFSAILQCRESAESNIKTNEFLALWAVNFSDSQTRISSGDGAILIKNASGQIVQRYENLKLITGGDNDWIMSANTMNAYAMDNPYGGSTTLELKITDITTHIFNPQPGDFNFTVSIIDHMSSGNPSYPRHTFHLAIKNDDGNNIMDSVLVVGVLVDKTGQVVDILMQEDNEQTQIILPKQEKEFNLSSISKTGRCVGPVSSEYTLHFWVSYFREDNQLMTKYFTMSIK